MNKYEDRLSVLIPTYNRKSELARVIEGLSKQTNKEFEVVISDNASNYDVNALLDTVDEELKNRIHIYVRPFNIGGSVNILECSSLCETKWAWLLSDDDIVKENAVEIIYTWIDKFPSCGCFNFSLCNMDEFKTSDYIAMESIDDFLNIYRGRPYCHGDLIFMSNKVYNMEAISDYMIYAFKYANSGLFRTILYAKILEKNIPFICVNNKVVEYDSESPRAWDVTGIMLASTMLEDVPYDISEKKRRQLVKIQAFNIETIYELFFICRGKDKGNNRYFFDKMYNGLYKYILTFGSRLHMRIIASTTKFDIGFYAWRTMFKLRFKLRDKAVEYAKNSKYKETIKRLVVKFNKYG